MSLDQTPFESLAQMNRDELNLLLRGIDPAQLALALKIASQPVVDSVLDSLPIALSEDVLERMDSLGAVRVGEVKAAQAAILDQPHTA